MKNYVYIKHILLIVFVVALFTPIESHARPDSVQNIVKAYGIENFDKINKMSYTFNVHIDGKNIVRKWVWYPKTGDVELLGDGIKYNRTAITESLKGTDHKFINDSYWLLFPFHLVWDENVEFAKSEDKQVSPINGESLNHLIVEYVNNAGYTPNDIYELYYDDRHIIKEWVFRPGGSTDKKRAMTWEQNTEHSGILISENHTGANNFKLWFTDIEFE